MPKKPIDYSRTAFYLLECKDPLNPYFYVGSSTSVSRKKAYHKACSLDPNKIDPISQQIRANGGWNNWNFIVLDEEVCESKTHQIVSTTYWESEVRKIKDRSNAFPLP